MSYQNRTVHWSIESFSTAELHEWLQTTWRRFRRVIVLHGGDGHADFETATPLPHLPEFHTLIPMFILIRARMSKDTTGQDLAAILRRAQVIRHLPGTQCAVKALFEKSGARQTKKLPEVAQAGFDAGRPYFQYTCRAEDDVAGRQEYFSHLVAELGLPIEVLEETDGFRLRHTGGESITFPLESDDRLNAWDFRCGLADTSEEWLASVVEKTVRRFGSGRVFEWGWRASQNRPSAGEVYQAVAKAELPATQRAVRLTYRLGGGIRNGFRAIATMSEWGRFDTPIFNGWLDEERAASFAVRTEDGSHRILVTMTGRSYLDEVSERTGLTFEFVEEKP